MSQKVAQDATRQSDFGIKNDLSKLRNELNFQTSINYRLSKELGDCQRRLGIESNDPLLQQFDAQHQIGYNSELAYLQPLLLCYDQRIQSLDSMVDSLIDDLKDLDKKSRHLVEDNNFLRQQLEQKNEQLLQQYKNGQSDDSVQGVFNKLQKDELHDRMRMLSEENQFYVQKIKEYENRLYEQQNRIDVYNKHEGSYINDIHELQEQLKRFEVDCSDLNLKKDVLENKLKNQIELNVFHEEERNELGQKLSRVENEAKILKHQVNQLRQQLQQLGENSNSDMGELKKELELSKQRERELFNKQMFSDRELDQIRDENRRLKKELEQGKNELDQMLKMMDNYDTRVQVLQKKEEQAIKINKELRDSKEAAQLEREKLLMREQQFDRTLQSMTLRNREELLQIRNQNDKQNEQYKYRNRIGHQQKEDQIKELQDEIIQLTINNERLTKENKSTRNELNRLENNLKGELNGSSTQTDDLLRQVTELTEKLHLSEQSNSENSMQASEQINKLQSDLKNTQNSNSDLRQALEQIRSQFSSVQQELTTQKSKISQITRTNSSLIEELSKTKKYHEQRLENIQDEYTQKLKNAQMQLDEALKREKNARERAVQLLQQYDQTEEKLKAEYNSRIQELEYQLQQLKNQNKVLILKVNEQRDQNKEQYGTLRK